jgi:hypothetical protein
MEGCRALGPKRDPATPGAAGEGIRPSDCIAGIPAYFYPSAGSHAWEAVAGMSRGTVLVVNPASGPGAGIDSNYSAALHRIRLLGFRLYGYVDTDYGARSADPIEADARQYRQWYGLTRVFLDQTASGAPFLRHYGRIAARLHQAGFEVAMNPGQPDIDRRYLDLAEHVVTFEGAYETYRSQAFPGWAGQYPRDKIWHLVYRVPDAATMRKALSLAWQRNAGVFYATDADLPNPWMDLPPYWPAEAELIGARS